MSISAVNDGTPTYDDWNQSIIEFVTANIPAGDAIYLAIDDEALGYIGATYLHIDRAISVDSFEASIRNRCTEGASGRNRKFKLNKINGYDEKGYPRCVAFLSSMVLAAHRMSGQDNIDQSNYFARLNALIDVPCSQQSRPVGMDAGIEESHWVFWNDWLEDNGWVHTARKGSEGAMKYLNYSIEQALLRDGDKEYLRESFLRAFHGKPHSQAMDEARLGNWLAKQRFSRKHLRAGFEGSDINRAEAFYDAAFRVYEKVDWSSGDENTGVYARNIVCGIKRKTSLNGRVSYQLFPRAPSQWKPKALEIKGPDDKLYRLKPFRIALFRPLWEQTPFSPWNISYSVSGDSDIDNLVFPARNFWILTRDPEDPRGSFATWEKYPDLIGKKFVLLVKGTCKTLIDKLEIYNKEKLIDWSAKKEKEDGKWIEYHGCMVLSRNWESVTPCDESIELYETLKPRQFATISLSKGLRAPNQGAWLEGHSPNLKIYGFEDSFKINIEHKGEVIMSPTVENQKELSLRGCDSPGVYRIKALWGNEIIAQRTFKIISWKDLKSASQFENIV